MFSSPKYNQGLDNIIKVTIEVLNWNSVLENLIDCFDHYLVTWSPSNDEKHKQYPLGVDRC